MAGNVRGFFAELGIALPDRGGENVQTRCFVNPKAHSHGDRHPSMSVNVEHGAWNCKSCGAKGGAYDAGIALGLTPVESMALLEKYGLKESRERMGAPFRSNGTETTPYAGRPSQRRWWRPGGRR